MANSLTPPLESAIRKKVDSFLVNLQWKTDEIDDLSCNVFTERVRTKNEEKKIRATFPKGRFPDYVLYESKNFKPIAIIEAKRIGGDLKSALKQGVDYAKCIDAPIVFATDGASVETQWVKDGNPLRCDGQLITKLLNEENILKFIKEDKSEITTPPKNLKTKEQLLAIFGRANDLLREEGMREGVERFTEFANLIFLKLIDEIEQQREANGEKRRIQQRYCWSDFYEKSAQDLMDYLNDTVLPKLRDRYNHSGDVFQAKLGIQSPQILKEIVDELSELTLLDINSDIKGDAFEYFLKNSVTVGNDLGEYYTPRHIVELMVELIDPAIWHTVYDPACGTGGFLIEAFRHIKRQCDPNGKDIEKKIEFLEEETIYGGELTGTAKIAKMNMILAGDGHTNIKQQDSLDNRVEEEYDIVLTNFPFSQKTRPEIAKSYGFQTKNANPVFLKHIIDSLADGGRAGVVVPDGLLFGKQKAEVAIRKTLVEECNIEAVLQMSVYTFMPYTKQPTSILIFKKNSGGGQTNKIWFFDVLNDGFKGSTKRKPIPENDLPKLRNLWKEKGESNQSFCVKYEDLDKENYKLFMNFYKDYAKVKNPKKLGDFYEKIIIGTTPPTKDDSYYGNESLWVSIADMTEQGRIVKETTKKLSQKGIARLGDNRRIKKGSLMMSFKLTIGKTAFAGEDLFTNEAICTFKLKPEYDTEEMKNYLYHILPVLDYTPYAQRATKGLTLNKNLIADVEIPFYDEIKRKELVSNLEELRLKREKLEKELEQTVCETENFIMKDIMGRKELSC